MSARIPPSKTPPRDRPAKPPRRAAPRQAPKPETGAAPEGERIAKVLARAGVASRREAERMIALGQVAVNGKAIDSPALNVTPRDRITVDGQPLAEKEPARLWLYHKPQGLVTSAADEKGRPTVFDSLPEGMPRVMSVGRLDLNSEGLLLLTNDGEVKRRLELPSTGWLRKYRVRVNGAVTEAALDPLRQGLTIDGERFQPMAVTLDRQQGANAWLTVGLREGRNREIRRAVNAVGLVVNRLIRVSYGPFRLGELEAGAVQEVKGRVLRDQLGLVDAEAEEDETPFRPARGPRGPKPIRTAPAASGARSAAARVKSPDKAPAKAGGARKAAGKAPAVPRGATDLTEPKRFGARVAGPGGKPAGARPSGGKPAGGKPSGAKPAGAGSRAGAPKAGAPAKAGSAKPRAFGSDPTKSARGRPSSSGKPQRGPSKRG